MKDFDTKLRQWERNQERDYERKLDAADFDEWLEEMTPEEREDYERRKEEAEGY
jgi:hypothetical protein